uniref:Peptidase S1 domain-containing protein n=1 Tax=Anopheles quadriannulatus TaxID=34691 RepID=A0A1Y9J0B6_ANOQN
MGLFALVLLWCVSDTLAASKEVEAWRAMQVRRPTPIEVRVTGRIFGGMETNIKDAPHQLSLRRFDSHICGASVVDASLAITAAHCLTPKPPPEFITLMGGSTNRTDYDVGVIFNAIEIIIHPGYNSNTFHNDVALVRIEGTFGGYENVAPIPLRTRTIFTSSSNPVYCTVSGWGLTNMNGDGLPEILRIVRIPLVPYTECRRKWNPFPITSSMICAGELRKDACNGDSGGPLVCNGQLYGIVSWGSNQCGSSYPGIYTSIPAVLSFLSEYMSPMQFDAA